VPGAAIGLHDIAHRARRHTQASACRFSSATSSGVRPSLGAGRWVMPLRSIQCCIARAFAQVVK
jgi:hypothetical protein